MRATLARYLRKLADWLAPTDPPPPTVQGGGPGDTPPPPKDGGDQ